MAAGEAAPGTGGAPTSRFAAACGALSQYVRDHDSAYRRALQLMPGADDEGGPEAAGPAPQLTIFYGGRVVVLDECTADRAAALMRLASGAAAQAAGTGGVCGELDVGAATDMPVARKASLQRFMEKRKGRLAGRGEPYRRPDASRRDQLALAL